MWQPLKNLVNSLQTYDVLSPDLLMRQRVNRGLQARPCLNVDDWYSTHWTVPAVARTYPAPLIHFIYRYLGQYSGLTIGRIVPQDRLLEDLQFPMVCWFDWGITLCEDMYTSFGVDVSDHFDETQFDTVYDLVNFLEQQLKARESV